MSRFGGTITDGTSTWHPRSACHPTWPRKLSSEWTSWTITLTVTNSRGEQDTRTTTATFRDLLTASLGDSAASGQGNPDAHGEPGQPRTASWAPGDGFRCDRSGRAASAMAARLIHDRDRATSVTFWHLGCSGATIIDRPPELTQPFEHGGGC